MRRTQHNKIFVASPRSIDLAEFYERLQELAKAGVPADNVVSSRARVDAATQYLSEDEELAEICQAAGEGEPQLAERFKKIRRSLCTLENPLWFSHRRATIAGKAHEGRMLALIVRE